MFGSDNYFSYFYENRYFMLLNSERERIRNNETLKQQSLSWLLSVCGQNICKWGSLIITCVSGAHSATVAIQKASNKLQTHIKVMLTLQSLGTCVLSFFNYFLLFVCFFGFGLVLWFDWRGFFCHCFWVLDTLYIYYVMSIIRRCVCVKCLRLLFLDLLWQED